MKKFLYAWRNWLGTSSQSFAISIPLIFLPYESKEALVLGAPSRTGSNNVPPFFWNLNVDDFHTSLRIFYRVKTKFAKNKPNLLVEGGVVQAIIDVVAFIVIIVSSHGIVAILRRILRLRLNFIGIKIDKDVDVLSGPPHRSLLRAAGSRRRTRPRADSDPMRPQGHARGPRVMAPLMGGRLRWKGHVGDMAFKGRRWHMLLLCPRSHGVTVWEDVCSRRFVPVWGTNISIKADDLSSTRFIK
jgi:hypothetical protein